MKITDYSLQFGKKLFVIDTNKIIFQIALQDISHIIQKNEETIIISNEWEKIYTTKSLNDFYENLKKFDFIKINDKTIVNKQNIYRFDHAKNKTITMKNMEIFKIKNYQFDLNY